MSFDFGGRYSVFEVVSRILDFGIFRIYSFVGSKERFDWVNVLRNFWCVGFFRCGFFVFSVIYKLEDLD